MEDAGVWTVFLKSLAEGGPMAVLLGAVLIMNYLRETKREDKLADKLDGIKDAISELNGVIVGVQKDQERTNERLDRVEDTCNRRHT